MKRNKIAVIGLGNTLLADEGAGIHTVRLLREKLNGERVVDIIEAGTPGMGLLHHLQDRDKVIFVDSGNCGVAPGEFIRFQPGDVRSRKARKGHSLHDFDLVTTLQWAQQNGVAGSVDLVVFCIQAAEMAMSEEVSAPVRETLPRLADLIHRELKRDLRHA
jgi:hydrogenase maturation protease